MPASEIPTHPLRCLLIGPLPSGKKWFGVLRVLAWMVIGLFFLPTYFFASPGFGAEPSWKLALNRAVSEGWPFGERILWTYGPLGFLEWRYPLVHQACYLGFDLLLLVVFLRFAVDVAKSNLDPKLTWACLLSLFTVKRLLYDQPSAALYCALVYLLVRNLARPGLLNSAGLILLSVLMLFFKLNFGLVGAFVCALVFCFQAATRQRSALIWLALLLGQMLLAWGVASGFHTRLIPYLKSSFLIITQYDHMAWGPGPGGVAHWVVFGFFWLFVAGALFWFRRNGLQTPATLYLLIGGAAVFVLYKTALIRSDYNHNKCFLLGFPLLCLAFLIHGPPSLRPLWRKLFLSLTVYVSLLLIAEFGNAMIYMQPEYLKVFFPINYFREMQLYHKNQGWNAYVTASLSNFSPRTVPQRARELIGTNRVDVLPFESTLALGSGLNYQPRPIPLTYGVIGSKLEQRNLLFLESTSAPRFLLYVLGQTAHSIDGRYHLWEEPAVKRFIAQNYQPVLVFTNLQGAPPENDPQLAPVLLLERKPAKRLTEVPFQTTRQHTGIEFPVPDAPDELYARIRLRKTWLGRLASFFYRGSEVMAKFTLSDGTIREGRILPANLETGVLMNFYADIAQPAQAINFLTRSSSGNPKCLAVEIHSKRSWDYYKEFTIEYFKLSPAAP